MIRNRYVCHPGIYIKEAIEELELNQSEFALRTGLSIKNVSTLISGDSNITFEVAVKLASFFQNDVEGWINLQTKYDIFLHEKTIEKEYDDDWKIAKQYDKEFISHICKVNITNQDKHKCIDELRKCFNVGSLQALKQPNMYVFCKTSVNKDIDEKTIIMRNSWVSIAEQTAKKNKCNAFDKDKLLDKIADLKRLTKESPSVFVPKLKAILSDAGINLVILPYLKNSNIGGVTKWNSFDQSVVVAINDCGKDADKFWFSLFHELGHAIKNHKRHMTISYTKNNIEDEEEKDANEFASNSLINPKDYISFVSKKTLSESDIKRFANSQGVAPFIVVGRLQKDGYVGWDKFQNLKTKYKIIY